MARSKYNLPLVGAFGRYWMLDPAQKAAIKRRAVRLLTSKYYRPGTKAALVDLFDGDPDSPTLKSAMTDAWWSNPESGLRTAENARLYQMAFDMQMTRLFPQTDARIEDYGNDEVAAAFAYGLHVFAQTMTGAYSTDDIEREDALFTFATTSERASQLDDFIANGTRVPGSIAYIFSKWRQPVNARAAFDQMVENRWLGAPWIEQAMADVVARAFPSPFYLDQRAAAVAAKTIRALDKSGELDAIIKRYLERNAEEARDG